MHEMTSLLAQYGLALVFLNVFLLQVGVPVPAVPTLMAAGALTVGGGFLRRCAWRAFQSGTSTT